MERSLVQRGKVSSIMSVQSCLYFLLLFRTVPVCSLQIRDQLLNSRTYQRRTVRPPLTACYVMRACYIWFSCPFPPILNEIIVALQHLLNKVKTQKKWRNKMKRSPFTVNLVAEQERIEEVKPPLYFFCPKILDCDRMVKNSSRQL